MSEFEKTGARGGLSSFENRFHAKLQASLAKRGADKDAETRRGLPTWESYQFNVGYAAALKDVLEDADEIRTQLME